MKYKISGSGPLFIFIPGLDGTGELFYRQEAELSKIFTVVSCSLRTSSNFTYQDLIDDLAKLINTLGKNPAILCGESFGGTLCLQFALAHPNLLEKLLIINSFPYFRNRSLFFTGRVLLEFTPYEFLHLGRMAAVNLGLLGEDLAPPDKEKFMALTTKLPKLPIVRRMDLIAEYDIRSSLSKINSPTLFLAGRKDRLQNSVLEAEFMASQMPNAKVKILENVGHIPLPSYKCSLLDVLTDLDFLPNL